MTNKAQMDEARKKLKCRQLFVIRHLDFVIGMTKRRPTKHVDAHRRRNQIPSRSILLRFELGEFFFGVSDVGFLSDTELKKLLLAA
jgi:hypothetical protein